MHFYFSLEMHPYDMTVHLVLLKNSWIFDDMFGCLFLSRICSFVAFATFSFLWFPGLLPVVSDRVLPWRFPSQRSSAPSLRIAPSSISAVSIVPSQPHTCKAVHHLSELSLCPQLMFSHLAPAFSYNSCLCTLHPLPHPGCLISCVRPLFFVFLTKSCALTLSCVF